MHLITIFLKTTMIYLLTVSNKKKLLTNNKTSETLTETHNRKPPKHPKLNNKKQRGVEAIARTVIDTNKMI